MLTHWLVQGTPTEEKLLTLFRDKFGLDDSEKPHELLMVRAWHELRDAGRSRFWGRMQLRWLCYAGGTVHKALTLVLGHGCLLELSSL